jgi:5'-nucleotidase
VLVSGRQDAPPRSYLFKQAPFSKRARGGLVANQKPLWPPNGVRLFTGRAFGLRALVTNDDGVGSGGLRRLALVAVSAGLEIVVAAPSEDQSGRGTSLTAENLGLPTWAERIELVGLEDVTSYAVAATPSTIVLAACGGAFGPPPDLVLSGINGGNNVGDSVIHSATVGAALTAATLGLACLAVSAPGPHNWESAAWAAGRLLAHADRFPRGQALSLNAPDLPPEEVLGLRFAHLAPRTAHPAKVQEGTAGRLTLEAAGSEYIDEPGSDISLLRAGWATVSALQVSCKTSPALDGVVLR